MDETRFLETVRGAWRDLRREILALGPTSGRRLVRWFTGLRGPRRPWRYLTDVRAFPLLRLPWYAEEAVLGEPDASFQRDLIRSSLAGYLHIRLIDDATDRRSPVTIPLLPALGPLHLLFEAPYRKSFPEGHPFFEDFRRLWNETAEATLRDQVVTAIHAAEYRRSAAKKTRAALIPLLAVLHRRERLDRAAPWERFVTLYGRWHQLEDDTFDWREDLAAGKRTWLLDQGARQVGQDQIGGWMIREGLGWAFATLDRLWVRAVAAARRLENPGLEAYLDRRLSAHLDRRRRHAEAHEDLTELVRRVQGRLENPFLREREIEE